MEVVCTDSDLDSNDDATTEARVLVPQRGIDGATDAISVADAGACCAAVALQALQALPQTWI